MGANGALLVVLTAPKIHVISSTAMSFSNVFLGGAVSTTSGAPFSPITFEKRQKSPLKVRGKIYVSDFGLNCAFSTF